MNIIGKTIKDVSMKEKYGSCCLLFNDNTTLRIDAMDGKKLFLWPNDPSSPTSPTAGVKRNENVGTTETPERKAGAAFGAAPLLDCNFQDLESFIYSNWKCSNPSSS